MLEGYVGRFDFVPGVSHHDHSPGGAALCPDHGTAVGGGLCLWSPGFLLQGRRRPIDLRSGPRRSRHRGDPASARARSTRRPREYSTGEAGLQTRLEQTALTGSGPLRRGDGFSDKTVDEGRHDPDCPATMSSGGLTRAVEVCSLARGAACCSSRTLLTPSRRACSCTGGHRSSSSLRRWRPTSSRASCTGRPTPGSARRCPCWAVDSCARSGCITSTRTTSCGATSSTATATSRC